MQMTRCLLAGCFAACGSFTTAASPLLTEIGRLVPGFDMPGRGGFAIADFDGDGREDIVVPGWGVLQVIGRSNDGFVVKQAIFLPWFDRVLATPPPGAPELVTVGLGGVVRRFSGWPLAETHLFDIGEGDMGDAAIGDIDNDGGLELVTSPFTGGLRVHDLATGDLRWQLGAVEASEILLAQLDGDPALEIVVSSGTQGGLVIDGATQATDWSYKDGFGYYMASGHFQPGGGAQFVGADNGIFTLFQSAPWSPLWDEAGFTAYAFAAGDMDGDGVDEILIGEHGSAIVFDSQTRSVRLEVPTEAGAKSAIAGWKADGAGGGSWLAFSPQAAHWPEHELFSVVNAADGSMALEFLNDKPGSYAAVAIGRLGQSRPSLVFGASEADNLAGAAWTQLAADTGTEQWESPPAPIGDMRPAATLIMREGTSAPALLLAGNTSFEGARFVSLDGATHALRWVRDHTTIPSLEDRGVADVRELELDGTRSLVACLDSGAGARLFMMDAETGAPQWESVAMDGNFEGCRHAMAGRFADGSDPLVVAVLATSLRAFNANTHLLEWVLGTNANGATLLEHGANGREFVVFSGTRLRFYDAATRSLLRELELDEPVTALTPLGADIHRLAVAAGGRILIVDGVTGAMLQSSDYFGTGLAQGNRLAVHDAGDGIFLIAAGSDDGVFRLRLALGEHVFADGFEIADR